MKTNIHRVTGIVLAMFASPGLRAEEPSPEIAGLEKAAADFILAYNAKDAAAIAALFTEKGEITDIEAQDVTTGREEIKAHYEDVFADKEPPPLPSKWSPSAWWVEFGSRGWHGPLHLPGG